MDIWRGNRLVFAVLLVLGLILTIWFTSQHNPTTRYNYPYPLQSNPPDFGDMVRNKMGLGSKVEDTSKSCPSKEPGFIPSLDEIAKLDHRTLEYVYHTFNSNMEVLCYEMIRMGHVGWGGWEVCHDPRFRPKPGCITYSFGIGFDWTFDDAMQQFYNCKVWSFDPTMKKPDHLHAKDVQFFNMGLSGKGVKKQGWLLKTLSEVKQQLGHDHIDILKIDIESSEWPAMTTALADNSLNNVTQLLIEYHDLDKSVNGLRMRLKIIHGIRKLGFRTFYAHKNDNCLMTSKFVKHPLRTICHEVHMVRLPECVGI